MASSKRNIGIFGLILGIVLLMAGGMFGQGRPVRREGRLPR